MTKIDYYFDYISPFSYLLQTQLHRLPNDTSIHYIPVLFAGLLKHWGSLGPVEIDRKKLFTYRHSTWLAEKLNVPFRTPDSHPFIPLPYLRLSVAMDNDPELVDKLFRAIWATDFDPATDSGRQGIWNEINIPDADSRTTDPDVKKALIGNTELAVQNGVFGVPTLVADGQLFWGYDSLEFLLDYLANKQMFSSAEMNRLETI